MNAPATPIFPALDVPYPMTFANRVPAKRYYEAEFYRLECERLWPRVWQMACRLEEIPKPGDYCVYDILDQSVIVTRVDANTIKAYENSCRHRGMRLVDDRGHNPSGFTCPFHGWCFDLNGKNSFLFQPSLFSRENLDPQDLRLREVRVETWGGMAFINFDRDAPPLRESLGPFAAYNERRNVDAMRSELWVSTILPANWKLAMEAFMEGYHVMQTHPGMSAPGAVRGPGAKYWGGEGEHGKISHVLVMQSGANGKDVADRYIRYMRIMNKGMMSMYLEKDIAVAESLRGTPLPDDPAEAGRLWKRTLNDGIVKWNRERNIPIPDLNALESSGVFHSVLFAFPNYFTLPLFGNMAAYRIRPLGPEQCLFEVWSLTLFPEGEERPPLQTPVPVDCQDLQVPPITREDFSNIPRQQKGLHARGFEFMVGSPGTELEFAL